MSYRQLVWRAEGRQRDDWNHTALLCAVAVNLQRAKGTPVARPAAFHPFERGGGSGGLDIDASNVAMIGRMFRRAKESRCHDDP